MMDFWLSCGHHLLDRDEGGGLVVTDAFLKAYLARPELAPPDDACVVERTLHAALLTNPRRPVSLSEIAAVRDPDARENWTMMVAFRDLLVTQRTVEAAYLHLVRNGVGSTPPLFLNQLVHVILRNVLDDCDDAYVLRAAEMFFRTQRMTTHEGALLAADDEVVGSGHGQPSSPLVSMLGLPAHAAIDVLNDDNADTYWSRSDSFDLAFDLTAGRRGQEALAQVMTRWIAHLLAVGAAIEPLVEARDVNLVWYVGLDAQASQIGDALWNGQELDDAARNGIIGLFRITVADPALVLDAAGGEPIYVLMAMTADGQLRLKPQNLVTGLPIREREPAS